MCRTRNTSVYSGAAVVGCLVAMLALSNRAVARTTISEIVVFGTSLSDPGNAFALFGELSTPPDYSLNPFLIPSAPYARGGHQFSNGATWIEQFARPLGLAGSVQPAFQGLGEARNFAVGAARAHNDGINVNLSQQVNAFLQRTGGVASPDALYVIEMGGNDVRDAFVAFASGGNGGPILNAALTSIAANIQALHAAGARRFLVWTVPNIALTPALRPLPPIALALATQVTVAFNNGLTQTLAQLAALPGITFVRLDAFQLLNAIDSNPSAFGLTNVTTACITPTVPPFACDRPDEFLFWDGIHPTVAGHALIAQLSVSVLFP